MKLRPLTMLSVAIMLSMSVLLSSGSLVIKSRAQTSSASNSLPQATPVTPADPDAGLRAACTDTLNELLKARILIASQDADITKIRELNGLTDQINAGLKNLRVLDAEQKQQLQNAVDAANREIAALKGENAILKKQRMTLWKKAKWFVIGGAVGVIAGAVLTRP